jgi:arsenate reductase (glutaredoxin)
MKIYHNPRCRKSRETLGIIEEAKKSPEIIEYLKNPPSEKELKSILKMLGISAQDLIRKGETVFKEKYKGKDFAEDKWIKIMTENPILIERPIVVHGGKAVLGRPPENVKNLL